MIISRTPFRISFFGGGTDYPGWFKDHPGAVLATTIDKYCYITARYLPPFFEHRSRIIYSKMEHVKERIDEIEHPAVRETLRFMDIHKGIEIHHDGDLPARAGLGSSSSFTVGLLHVLHSLKGMTPTKGQLAREAVHIEQDMIRENVGCQDQTLAAYGGFNRIEFGGAGHLNLHKVLISDEHLMCLQDHMMIFFTGLSRTASEIAAYQVANIPRLTKELSAIHAMVGQSLKCLDAADFKGFGKLLDEGWRLKRSLSDKISTSDIDHIYTRAMKAGALGGKLLGAGGGGFVLIYAEPDKKQAVRKALSKLLEIPFKFETQGSQIIFYQPNSGVVA
jgi:D-glycero-alpha-D-manno-heptose-7-phosphate kinase